MSQIMKNDVRDYLKEYQDYLKLSNYTHKISKKRRKEFLSMNFNDTLSNKTIRNIPFVQKIEN